jgi:hypothetical protein
MCFRVNLENFNAIPRDALHVVPRLTVFDYAKLASKLAQFRMFNVPKIHARWLQSVLLVPM